MFGRFRRSLYLQVLLAVVLGATLGALVPDAAVLEPLGTGFIKLVKMLIGPIVFVTVVTGIAKMGNLKRVGRVGLKALIYFEVVTTLALLIGYLVGELVQPGSGMGVDPSKLDASKLAAYTGAAKHLGTVDFILNVIPTTVVDAFAKGEVLQILVISILFGLAVSRLGAPGQRVVAALDTVGKALFGMVELVMRLAPIGAFGAMAFTVGTYGLGALAGLGRLMACFYLTSLLFVALVLGAIARWAGLSLWRFVRYLREEIFIVLATSSSESVLPRMIEKLERAGCSPPVVGLVVPMGYSFNLDGTSIYLTLATLFLAQAMGIHVPISDELGILGVLLLTSKGAAAVTGGGFITLAATLSSTGPIPVAGLTLLLGVDRFMSEARAITNLIGNGVATVVVAKWEGELDTAKLAAALADPPPEPAAATG